MGFNGGIKANKSTQVPVPVGGIFELDLAKPPVHQGADDAFSLPVGLGTVNDSEFLPDVLALAGDGEACPERSRRGVTGGAPILLAVIGISVFDLVRALRQHDVDQETGGAVLRLIGQDGGVQLPGEVINSDEQVTLNRR